MRSRSLPLRPDVNRLSEQSPQGFEPLKVRLELQATAVTAAAANDMNGTTPSPADCNRALSDWHTRYALTWPPLPAGLQLPPQFLMDADISRTGCRCGRQ